VTDWRPRSQPTVRTCSTTPGAVGPSSARFTARSCSPTAPTRDWAGAAIASQRHGGQNRLEALGTIGRPEDHYHETEPAARAEASAAQTQEQLTIARGVETLADAAQSIDTEADLAGNTPTLRATAEAAADVLIAAGTLLGGDEFIIAQANETLGDLVGLTGWQNQLGPRFEAR
jgi:hypothetical protein